MKYLVTCQPAGKEIPPAQAVAMIRAAIQWIEARLTDGSMDSVHLFPDRGGICIMNAESHEAIMTALLGYPAFPLYTWDVKPLADWRRGFETVIGLLEREGGQTRT